MDDKLREHWLSLQVSRKSKLKKAAGHFGFLRTSSTYHEVEIKLKKNNSLLLWPVEDYYVGGSCMAILRKDSFTGYNVGVSSVTIYGHPCGTLTVEFTNQDSKQSMVQKLRSVLGDKSEDLENSTSSSTSND